MLELSGALANVWLQSGLVAVCGLVAARCVRSRGATWSATVLRATWLGIAFCLVLSMASFSSRVSQRALWKVSLPTISGANVESATTNNSTFQNTTPPVDLMSDATSLDATSLGATALDAIAPKATAPDNSSTRLPSSTDSALVNSPDVAATQVAPVARDAFFFAKIALMLWLAGSASLLFLIGVCALKMRRVVRTSTRIEDEAWRATLREICAQMKLREPRLLQSEGAQSPFLTGWFRPAIVLPVGDFAASSRFVLLHELTHLARRDLWWNMAARLCCAVLWTQPALWVLQRACERVGEEVCDEAVVRQSQSPQQYAQCLLDLAESWQPARAERLIGAGVVPLRSALARRVQNILQFSRRSSMIISRRARCAIGVLTLGVVAASWSLVAVQTEAKTATEPAAESATSSTRVDLSSPEATVRSLVSALNRRDSENAVRCLEGGAIFNPLLRYNSVMYSVPYTIMSVKSRRLGNSATVQIHAHVGAGGAPKTFYNRRELTNLRLVQRDGKWKIARSLSGSLGNDQSFLQLSISQLAPPYRERLEQWAANRGKAVVTGRLVNEDGRPMARTRGYISSQNTLNVLGNLGGGAYRITENFPERVHNLFQQRFETDAKGQFRISGLTTSRYKIYWSKNINGYHATKPPAWVQSQDVEVVAREGSSTRAPDVVLASGGLINMRVVDTAGKGLPFIQISYSKMEADRQFRVMFGATTDSQGRVIVRVVPGATRVSLRLVNGLKAGRSLIQVGDSWYEAPSKSGRPVRNQRDADSTSSVIVNVFDKQQQQVVFKLRRIGLRRIATPKTATSSTRVDLSSPEATVRSFVNAIVSGDNEQAAACVEGALPLLNPSLKGKSSFTSPSLAMNFQTQRQGDKAAVRVQARLQWKSPYEKPIDRQEVANLRLIRRNGAWKIARPFLKYSQNERSPLQDRINQLAPPYREKLQQWAAKRGMATVTGRVFYEDGRPAANVRGLVYGGSIYDVMQSFGGWTYSRHDNLPTGVRNLAQRLFITDKNGAFRITGLTSLRYSIGIEGDTVGVGGTHVDLAQWIFPNRTTHVFARGGAITRSSNIVLTRAGIVSVRVVDKATKKGLPFVGCIVTTLADQKRALAFDHLVTDTQGLTSTSIVPGKVRVSLQIGYPPNSRRRLLKVGDSWYDSPLKPGALVPYKSDPQNISQTVEIQRGKRREVVFEMERVDKAKLHNLPPRH